MQRIDQLTREIEEILDTDGSGYPVAAVAEEFAKLTTDANARLDQCMSMMANGSEYQALQLAESDPVLLDTVASLSFRKLTEWIRYCEQKQISVPPRIDSKAVTALNELYARGISPNHPLYKDYRSAVTSRDDLKAIKILRTIARLNPTDLNAKSEIERLENKLFQAKLETLAEYLRNGDENAILHNLAELESAVDSVRLGSEETYNQAVIVRQQVRLRGGIAEANALIADFPNLHRNALHQNLAQSLKRISSLQQENGFTLTPDQQKAVREMTSYLEQEKAKERRDADFRNLLAQATTFANSILVQKKAGLQIGEKQVDSQLLELSRLQSELRRTEQKVPADIESLLSQSLTFLQGKQKAPRRKKAAGYAFGAIIIICALGAFGWYGYHFTKENETSVALHGSVNARHVQATEDLIASLKKNKPELASSNMVAKAIRDAEAWCRDQRSREKDFQTQVTNLEHELSVNPLDFIIINNKANTLKEAFAYLAPELQSKCTVSKDNILSTVESRMTQEREKIQTRVESLLGEAEKIVGDGINYERLPEDIKATLLNLEPTQTEINKLTTTNIAGFQLSPEVTSRVRALQSKIKDASKSVSDWETLIHDLNTCNSYDKYRATLNALKRLEFVNSPEVIQAKRVADIIPSQDAFLGMLLMPGQPWLWGETKKAGASKTLMPDSVEQYELSAILALRDNELLKNIYTCTLHDYDKRGAERNVYSQGHITSSETDASDGLGRASTVSGKIFDPVTSIYSGNFTDMTFRCQTDASRIRGNGQWVQEKRLSDTSAALERLNLKNLFDDSGTKYEHRLIDVFAQLGEATNAPVLFKAYVYQELMKIIDRRPTAFGLQFSSLARGDFEKFKQVTRGRPISANDWYSKISQQELNKKLADFFERASLTKYYKEALLHQRLFDDVSAAGLTFAGYIGLDGKPIIIPEVGSPTPLWTLSGDLQLPLKLDKTTPGVPFSPIFFVKIDMPSTLTSAFRYSSSDMNDQVLHRSLPLLFN